MIAVDTNILVYAHRRDSEWNDAAFRTVAELASGRGAWAIPWPALHEFFGIVTHPRIYDPPSTTAEAIDQIEAWLAAPTVVLLAEDGSYWSALRPLLEVGRIAGPRVHDARIAALCVAHGIRELLTADRDFNRFSAVRARNPMTGQLNR